MRAISAILAAALLAAPGVSRGQELIPARELVLDGEPGRPARAGKRGPTEEATPAKEATPFEEPIDPDRYVCGRGDTLELNLWGRENVSHRLVVDSEGRTFLPQIGYVRVEGKTLSAARSILIRSVRRYYPGLRVDLSLVEPRTFLVHVVGDVGKPGLYRATPLVRVGTLLETTGAKGSRRRIEVRRRDGRVLTADLVLYEQGGDVTKNPLVMDGDVIHVPFAEIAVSVKGAVRRPGRFELVETRDLAELMELVGGLTSDASRRMPIRIVRRDRREKPTVLAVAMPAPGKPFPSIPLEDDDEVHVDSAASLQPTVLVVGARKEASPAQARPGEDEDPVGVRRVPVARGDTVRRVLERAGGLPSEADLGAAYLDRRRDGEVRRLRLDLDALLVAGDARADVLVQPGDVIVVPAKRRIVYVSGAVAKPGPYPFNPRYRLDEYLTAAGGLTRDARDKEEVKVLRVNGKTLPYRADAIVAPGDTVVAPQRNYGRSEVVQITLGVLGVATSILAVVLVASQ